MFLSAVCCQFEKKKDARTKRFGLNAEEDRRLERAKRFNLETSEVVRVCCSIAEPFVTTIDGICMLLCSFKRSDKSDWSVLRLLSNEVCYCVPRLIHRHDKAPSYCSSTFWRSFNERTPHFCAESLVTSVVYQERLFGLITQCDKTSIVHKQRNPRVSRDTTRRRHTRLHLID